MWKQQSFKIKSQESTEDDKKKWYIFKAYTCCPVLAFLFCYQTYLIIMEKYFHCLLTGF